MMKRQDWQTRVFFWQVGQLETQAIDRRCTYMRVATMHCRIEGSGIQSQMDYRVIVVQCLSRDTVVAIYCAKLIIGYRRAAASHQLTTF